ncbi:MAG: peptidase dimerization domain-containing protein, partial [Verrucomicrobiota bacterium]
TMQANLSNTVNPTIVRAGSKVNVVPDEVVIDVDGRISPGSNKEELLQEIRDVIGDSPEIELLHEEAAAEFITDTEVYREIVNVMNEHDPESEVVPYQIYGSTDSRNYAKLGATCYGFYPVKMPDDVEFSKLFHGVDERIPVEGFRFGIQALYDLVSRVVA